MWVKRELSYALIQRRFQNRIVPVVRRKCDYEKLHWALASFQMVNAAGDFAGVCRELLRTWGLRYKA